MFTSKDTDTFDAQKVYKELCEALRNGNRQSWDSFKALSEAQQASVFSVVDVDRKAIPLLHAAIDGRMPEIINEIIDFDRKLRKDKPPLTSLARISDSTNELLYPQMHARNQIKEEKALEEQKKLTECIKILINQPIAGNGNTPLHAAVINYMASESEKRPNTHAWLNSLEKMVSQYNADFNVQNDESSSPLSLVVQANNCVLLNVFIKYNPEAVANFFTTYTLSTLSAEFVAIITQLNNDLANPQKMKPVQQPAASNPSEYYQELFDSLWKGDVEQWNHFKGLPQSKQNRILDKMDVYPKKTIIHAAINARMPHVVAEIIAVDKALDKSHNKYKSPLTWYGHQQAWSYGMKKVKEASAKKTPLAVKSLQKEEKTEQKDTDADVEKFTQCVKNLINEPMDKDGNTILHMRIKNYNDSKYKDRKNEVFTIIQELVSQYGADFTVKNKAGKSSLDLVFEEDCPDIFILFLNNDKERKILNATRPIPVKCLQKVRTHYCHSGWNRMHELKRFFQENFGNEVYPYECDAILHQIFPDSIKLEETKIEIGDVRYVTVDYLSQERYELSIKGPRNHYLVKFIASIIAQHEDFYSLGRISNHKLSIEYSENSFHFQVKFDICQEYILNKYYRNVYEEFPWTRVLQDTLAQCESSKKLPSKENVNLFQEDVKKAIYNTAFIPVMVLCQLIAEYCLEMSITTIEPEDFQVMGLKYPFTSIPRQLDFNNRKPAIETCINAVLQGEEKLEVFSSFQHIRSMPNDTKTGIQKTKNIKWPNCFIFAAPKKSDQKPDEISDQKPKKLSSSLVPAKPVKVEDCEDVILFVNKENSGWQLTFPNPLYRRK